MSVTQPFDFAQGRELVEQQMDVFRQPPSISTYDFILGLVMLSGLMGGLNTHLEAVCANQRFSEKYNLPNVCVA